MTAATPTFAEFEGLLDGRTVVPVWREILADTLTPVQAYAAVGGGAGSYLLESVVGGEARARYSFVGFDPDLHVAGGDGYYEVTHADGSVTRTTPADPWQALRETLSAYRVGAAVPADLPPFWGGAVGYVSYDAVRRFEPTVGPPARAVVAADEHDFSFSIGGTLLVFDNARQTLRIIVPVKVGEGTEARDHYDDAVARIDAAERALSGAPHLPMLMPPDHRLHVDIPPSSFDRASYCAAVERCKEYIRAGDIFQVVLSQRFVQPATRDLFEVYRYMRCLNPSPYMYFLRFPEARIAGASPETLVRLRAGVAEVRPIAGTRKRGVTREEDARIEADLFADPKEIAEHVMLVDLGRNDIGRISDPGTVAVTERMVAEYYSHVMHITSNVQGRVSSGRDAIDVLRATFPAGTLSGAPKVRAMQIIEELEPGPRGIYGGAIGYIGFDGNMDVAIAIRTIVERHDQHYVQAGAGIVEASRPEAEYEETLSKARAPLVSIAAALRAQVGDQSG
ncbi:MAG: anthranilate synthase component I family protein [Myxococcales bacterium]|nr:anthranilate synthase component I family protein [Myxococcales bacterium]